MLNEVEERMTWLDQMEKLGEAKKYQSLIRNQVTEKLQEIKRLEQRLNEGHLEEQLNQLSVV